MQIRHVILLIIAVSLVSFGIGFSTSLLYQDNTALFGQIGNTVVPYSGLIVSLIGGGLAIWQTITRILSENVLEYAGIYKKGIDHAQTVTTSGWGHKLEHNIQTAYFLRLRKKRGRGQVQNCEGLMQVEGTDIRRHAVWEGEHRYISIGIQGDLELFEISSYNKEIIFHTRTSDTVALQGSSQPYNDVTLNRKFTVTVVANNGTVPSKPFTSTIRNVIEQAIQD
jgi:hypothetical protein